MPAKIAPAIGAAQNTHSCSSAAVSAKIAVAVLLAGFTDVLDTGIVTKCISVNPKPITIPAKPAGAFLDVAPSIINKNIKVKTTSVIITAIKLYFPGESSPNPLEAKPPALKPACPEYHI